MIFPPDAHVRDTGTAKGRGVFASRGYSDGEIVERCPVIIIEQPFSTLPEALKTIVFNWGVLANTSESSAVALGFGSMYNHSNPSNMRYEAIISPPTLVLSTVRPVGKGEELTINYNALGGGPIWDNDNWFERNKITPIIGPQQMKAGPNPAFDRNAQRQPRWVPIALRALAPAQSKHRSQS